MAKFGKDVMDAFMLSKDHTFVNHGSYGATPRKVFQSRVKLLERIESAPDMWFRVNPGYVLHQFKAGVEAAARLLGAKPDNLTLVQNTTVGFNTVLKSLSLQPGDQLLTYTWTYGALRNALNSVAVRTGAEVLTVDIKIPIRDKQEIIDRYREVIEKNKNIKFALIDWISSVPCSTMPYKELLTLCKEHGIMVMIDGAHTPGQVPINLEELGADFYVGNLHKWAFAVRGCAALWMQPCHRQLIHPLVTSSGYLKDDLHAEFYYQGTDDISALISSKDAVSFLEEDLGGLPRIQKHNSELVEAATKLLEQRWDTERFPIPTQMEAPYMRMIRLPDIKRFPIPTERVFGDLTEMTMELWCDHNIMALCCFAHGRPYVRISAQVYNTLEDYEALAEAVLAVAAK